MLDGYQHEERLEAHFCVGAVILILGFPGKIAISRKHPWPPGAASAPRKRRQILNCVYRVLA